MSDEGDLFEIVEVDVHGQPMRVFRNAPPSLLAIWELSAVHGEATYLVYEEERYSFARAHEIVASLAMHLVDLRDRQGRPGGPRHAQPSRVGVVVLGRGLCRRSGRAVERVVDRSGTGLRPGRLRGAGPLRRRGTRRAPHAPPDRDQGRAGDRRTRSRARCHPAPSPSTTFCRSPATLTEPCRLCEIDPDDDATIMYTSGTTGRPKGAVGTNRNIGGHVMNAVYAARRAAGNEAAPPSPAPVAATLLTFPLFHVGGLHSLPHPVHGRRREAGPAVQVGHRQGARPHRAGGHQRRRRSAHDDVRVARRGTPSGPAAAVPRGGRVRARPSYRRNWSAASTSSSPRAPRRPTATA